MGKINLAVNIAKSAVNFAKNGKFSTALAERTAKFAKACGKKNILLTAPPPSLKGLSLEGLKFAPKVKGDICAFTKDPSLAPELLDDLLRVKGSKAEKIEQIKNRFLQAMGYKNPELVKPGNQTFNCDLAVDFMDGKLSFNNKDFPIQYLIAAERHELDHLDKFAKLVKAEGVEKAENALMTGIHKYFTKIEKPFDREFWLKMSKDADITGFDSKKYMEALENYRYDVTMKSAQQTSFYRGYLDQYLYCTNELEKSAYGFTKKVLKHYGVDDLTQYDLCAVEFGKIKNLLEKIGKSPNRSEGFTGKINFDQLYTASICLPDPAAVKHLKYLIDVGKGKIAQNPEKFQEAVNALNEIGMRRSQGREVVQHMDNVYNWLKEGKFTFDDVLPA